MSGFQQTHSMSNNLKKGKLKRWNDDKGFGFIDSEDGKRDVFIHISALKRMGRRPATGDVIVYDVYTDNDGKKRAVNAKIEGVAEIKTSPARRNVKNKNTSNWLAKVIFFVLVVVIGSIAYIKLIKRGELREEPTASMFSYVTKENKNNFSCAGKIYCSQMTSCDEAKFYLRNCPGTKMDGDSDGIPCERQWCGRY
jgi:cold shock CspA family protein